MSAEYLLLAAAFSVAVALVVCAALLSTGGES